MPNSDLIAKLVEVLRNAEFRSQRTGDDEKYAEFLAKFPAREVGDITLDRYCIGKPVENSHDRFCWWLEHGLANVLGRYSPGSSRGHLIYIEDDGNIYQTKALKERGTPQENIADLMKVHQEIAEISSWEEAARVLQDKYFSELSLPTIGDARMLRVLSAYNPDWIIPINSKRSLKHFLQKFEADISDENKNQIFLLRELTEIYDVVKASLPDTTPYGFMRGLYSDELGISRDVGGQFETKLTAGAITNGYVSVPKNQKFFPDWYVSSNSEDPDQNFTLKLPSGDVVETYVLANFRRIRKRFTALFKEFKVKAGDTVVITELGEGEYEMSFKRNSAEEKERVAEIMGNKSDKRINLNTILFGPPGTGKTYKTVQKAVNIIQPDFQPDEDLDPFEQYKARYDEFLKSGQIRFVTFHQSFSYEDFVEGIRPQQGEDGNLSYEVCPGVFKEIVEAAKRPAGNALKHGIGNKTIWKMSLGNTLGEDAYIYDECLDNNVLLLGYGDDLDFSEATNLDAVHKVFQEHSYDLKKSDYPVNAVNSFRNKMKIGDLVVVSDGNRKFRQVAEIIGDYQLLEKDDRADYLQCRKVKWLLDSDKSMPAELILNTSFSQMTLYRIGKENLDRDKLSALIYGSQESDADETNHVLIIDEINRGNISRIFGELITLIEEDKRAGGKDAREVILPYSREAFSVPDNLYILGTMNTADRSLAKLDIALRRRFVFEEMAPDSQLLSSQVVEGVPLSELLDTINQRIALLLDKDHTIGHAYFMTIENLDDLRHAFEHKVIPLLQEYFYNDWERIRWVLNDQSKSADQQIISVEEIAPDVLPNIEEHLIDKNLYSLDTAVLGDAIAYKQIIKADGL